jgi:hypothetical protein
MIIHTEVTVDTAATVSSDPKSSILVSSKFKSGTHSTILATILPAYFVSIKLKNDPVMLNTKMTIHYECSVLKVCH